MSAWTSVPGIATATRVYLDDQREYTLRVETRTHDHRALCCSAMTAIFGPCARGRIVKRLPVGGAECVAHAAARNAGKRGAPWGGTCWLYHPEDQVLRTAPCDMVRVSRYVRFDPALAYPPSPRYSGRFPRGPRRGAIYISRWCVVVGVTRFVRGHQARHNRSK